MFLKYFRNLSRHARFDSRNRNTRFFHWFTFESITNACSISYANRKHVVDDSQRIRQNNAQIEHEIRLISFTSKDFKRAQTCMNEVVIVHELIIFDKRRFRFISESNIIQSRALKISTTTKKENRHSSRYSLKVKMKNLLRHHARVDFDSNREHRQKTFAADDQLKKIENSISTQIRIEKFDFVDFLFRRKIFEVTLISCRCDWNNQTIKHVIMFYELINDKNLMLNVVNIIDYH
jgi:hypothetical protein